MTVAHPWTPRRIAVVGTSGSGKTTLARQLAQRLGIPHIELDAIYWGADWTPAPHDVFRERATVVLSGRTWTVDGNYSTVRDIVWRRADTLVWLDYPLPVVMGRVTSRKIRRAVTGERLWSDNRENLRQALFSRESMILYALRTYWRRRKEYPLLLTEPQYAHLHVVRLRSPGAAQDWLAAQSAEAEFEKL